MRQGLTLCKKEEEFADTSQDDRDVMEARKDLWKMSGHHSQLVGKFIDVVRETQTNLDFFFLTEYCR